MKAEELMIDNFITHSDYEYCYVTHINSAQNVIRVMNNDFTFSESDEEDFSPIPLTEEWLEKFGFKKIDEEEWSLADLQVSRNVLRNIFVWHPYIDVKYVHQLQNLYHALTGKQLTVKK